MKLNIYFYRLNIEFGQTSMWIPFDMHKIKSYFWFYMRTKMLHMFLAHPNY